MGNQATERFTTGNHVAIFLRGDGVRELIGTGEVGRMSEATSIDMQSQTGARHLHAVGSAEPVDIVDGAHTYNVTLSLMRLRNREAVNQMAAGTIDIDEIDRITSKRIRTAEECHLVSGNLNTPANSPVLSNMTFAAMRIH